MTLCTKGQLEGPSALRGSLRPSQKAACSLNLGIKVDPGAIGISQGRPVSGDGAGVLHQGEVDAGAVCGGWQGVLQPRAEHIRTGRHRLHATLSIIQQDTNIQLQCFQSMLSLGGLHRVQTTQCSVHHVLCLQRVQTMTHNTCCLEHRAHSNVLLGTTILVTDMSGGRACRKHEISASEVPAACLKPQL